MPNVLVCWDEAGDVKDAVFLEIKEFMNAAEKRCGWIMMGANGLQRKLETGITRNKPGFYEVFSRFGDRFAKIVPEGKDDKEEFYRKMIREVVTANVNDKSKIDKIVKQALVKDSGRYSGLRRVENLIALSA